MNDNTEWVYYKRAVISNTPPHENVNTAYIESGKVWKKEGKQALLARWISDFDCKLETSWWYVIKTEPFDITAINSKKRYKINRGLRHFDIKKIDPKHYKEQIYQVQVNAYSDYPEKYRPTVKREYVYKMIEEEWEKPQILVFGAFDRETEQLEGYIQLECKGKSIYSVAQKANPKCEKYQINYALLAGVLDYIKDFLNNGYYMSVGARNIQHETAFQDFVEDIFAFRKAYCKLHIAYRPGIKGIVNLLFMIRKPLRKMDNIGFIHKINGVLKMEEIVRNQAEEVNL